MIGRLALIFCGALWCACGALALAALVGRARRAMRRYGVSARVVFLLAAAACVMLAGGKGGSVSVRDDYIQDAGSYLTNDVAHVALSKKTPNLPDSTEILVYARELSSTNAADWFRLSPHLTFADHPYDYALPNATNYSVLVSSSFVPEPTVHTNGVWALRGFEIPGHAGRYAFGNSRTRKDVPYDAEVEYLQSTGTQWIDTGVNKPGVGAITRWEAVAGFDSSYNAVRKFVAGYEFPSAMYYCEFNQSQFGGVGWNVRYFCNATLETETLYKVSMLLSGATVTYSVLANGETITKVAAPPGQSDIAISGKFLLFCMQPNRYAGPGVRIGTNQLWIDGVLVRDLVPVRVGNVGELYDRVTGTLMERHGTLIIGPDK